MPLPADTEPDFQGYAHPERLVSASWLSAHLGAPGLRVVESDEDSLLYDIGHIPGAVRIDWLEDLNDNYRRDYIDADSFAQLMRLNGISRDDTVVVYGDKYNWWAAYTAWVFTLFGHRDVRILNGGRDSWMAEERDSSFIVPDYPYSTYDVPTRTDAPHRALFSDVLDSMGTATIVDVRDREEYDGIAPVYAAQTGAATERCGHIPGAVNIPVDRTVLPNGRFLERATLDTVYSELDPHAPTIVYGHRGYRSAHTWFVLTYLLGFDNVRNYDGSWIEWGNMVGMPVSRDVDPGASRPEPRRAR